MQVFYRSSQYPTFYPHQMLTNPAQYSLCGTNHGRFPSNRRLAIEYCTFYKNKLGQILCTNLQLHFNLLHLLVIFFCLTPPHPLRIQVTFHLDIFFSLPHNYHRRKVAVLLIQRREKSLYAKLFELIFRLSTCFNFFFHPKRYMHAQTLPSAINLHSFWHWGD